MVETNTLEFYPDSLIYESLGSIFHPNASGEFDGAQILTESCDGLSGAARTSHKTRNKDLRTLSSWLLHASAVQCDAIQTGGSCDIKLVFGATAEAKVGYKFRYQDFTEQTPVGCDAMDAIRG